MVVDSSGNLIVQASGPGGLGSGIMSPFALRHSSSTLAPDGERSSFCDPSIATVV